MSELGILDKDGYRVLSPLRQMVGRLRAKPDKYKLDAFLEQLVVTIEDLQEQVNRLEAEKRQ